jgi:hypothetical protein
MQSTAQCARGSRGDEEPVGKNCNLPRFHIMNRVAMFQVLARSSFKSSSTLVG